MHTSFYSILLWCTKRILKKVAPVVIRVCMSFAADRVRVCTHDDIHTPRWPVIAAARPIVTITAIRRPVSRTQLCKRWPDKTGSSFGTCKVTVRDVDLSPSAVLNVCKPIYEPHPLTCTLRHGGREATITQTNPRPWNKENAVAGPVVLQLRWFRVRATRVRGWIKERQVVSGRCANRVFENGRGNKMLKLFTCLWRSIKNAPFRSISVFGTDD